VKARTAVLDRLVAAWPKGWNDQRCDTKLVTGSVPAISFARLRDFAGSPAGKLSSDETEVKLTSLYFSGNDHFEEKWMPYSYEQVATERAPLFDARVAAVVHTAKLTLPSSVKFTGTFFGGEYLGGIRFVDLESGAVLCQTAFKVVNSDTVTKGFMQNGTEAARADLGKRIDAAKEAAVRRSPPASAYPGKRQRRTTVPDSST
jgi:hypothetical protein